MAKTPKPKKTEPSASAPPDYETEMVALDALTPHPQNYRDHPDDEIEHLMASITEHGLYRNVVIAQDGTLLAGHGVVQACRRLGLSQVPVRRVPYAPDDPRALKLLAADNEIAHLAEVDDRALSELLRGLKESGEDLLGTGYDALMLANLVMVTRPTSEIEDFDAAKHWVGMPDYGESPGQIQVTVHFASEEDRMAFAERLGLSAAAAARKSLWWPEKERDDVRNVRFMQRHAPGDEDDDVGDGDDDESEPYDEEDVE